MENKIPIINRLNLFILYYTQAANKKISQSDLAKQLLTSKNNIIDAFNNADKLPDDLLFRFYYFLLETNLKEIDSDGYKSILTFAKNDLLIDIREEIQNRSKTFNAENTRGRRI